MLYREIIGVCLFWQFIQSNCSIAHVKYSKLKAINWGLPLAGHKLHATPIATSRVTNHIKCMGQCGKTKGCVAINLGPPEGGERKCEMLDKTRYSPVLTVNFTVKAGWTYVGPKVILTSCQSPQQRNYKVKWCLNFQTKCDANPCPKETSCVSGDGYQVDLYICLDLTNISSCQQYRDVGFLTSGVYPLRRGGQLIPTYCDQEDNGGGWLVFVRNDAQDPNIFNTDWPSYQNGFGDLDSNFWWGNENLHQFTKSTPCVLKVDLMKPDGTTGYVQYTGFQISDEDDGYRLSFDTGSYSGDGGNWLPHHNNRKFSTPERDLDGSPANCAAQRKCGWWFGYCSYATPTRVAINWGSFNPSFIQLKIRPM